MATFAHTDHLYTSSLSVRDSSAFKHFQTISLFVPWYRKILLMQQPLLRVMIKYTASLYVRYPFLCTGLRQILLLASWYYATLAHWYTLCCHSGNLCLPLIISIINRYQCLRSVFLKNPSRRFLFCSNDIAKSYLCINFSLDLRLVHRYACQTKCFTVIFM